MKMDKEQLEKVEKKMEQLKNQRQAILNHQRKQEQKQRTRRLIQNGAIAEQYLQCEEITPEKLKELFESLKNNPDFVSALEESKNKIDNLLEKKNFYHYIGTPGDPAAGISPTSSAADLRQGADKPDNAK